MSAEYGSDLKENTMKSARTAVLIVLCVLAVFALGRTADAQQDKRPKHVIWEYRDAANLNLTQLNAMGAEGWELVVITPYGKDYYYVFKRAKLDAQAGRSKLDAPTGRVKQDAPK